MILDINRVASTIERLIDSRIVEISSMHVLLQKYINTNFIKIIRVANILVSIIDTRIVEIPSKV